jgi:thioester reductase-like protein
VPSAFVILESLPLTPNGKLDRKALPLPDQLRLAERSDYVEPRDVVELKLVQIWEEVLNVKPVGVTDNFFDLGGHSLLVVRLMSRIQEEFGRELSLATIFQQPTIEQLAVELRDEGERVWSPLVPIQRQGWKPPIFCIHPAGGTAFCYVLLSRYLGAEQPCYGLQAFGLELGQVPYSRIEEIAAYYLESVRAIQPEGPYLLGGWSLGGVIAFEMAQQLRRADQEVALLALLDSEMPPQDLHTLRADVGQILSDANLLMMMVRRKNLPMTPEEFQQLSPEEQLSVAVETARRTNIIPPDAGPEQIQRFMQVLKANFKALLQYKPEVYPGRLTYLKTEIHYDENVVLRDDNDPDLDDPARGWSKYSSQPVDVYTVPGDHTTMLSEPHVRGLAEQLSACIAEELASREIAQPTVEEPAGPVFIDVVPDSTDLHAEAVLPADIVVDGLPGPVAEPKAILLTGATGFIGAFLLQELLATTNAKVYCIVRASSEAQAQQRLQRTLERYLLWDGLDSSRIVPVVGDLAQPRLGLSEAQFEHLAREIDIIYHNGAQVNFAYPYQWLKRTNVQGTEQVLRLATQAKIKPVHFVSTVATLSETGQSSDRVLREDDSLDEYLPVYGGGYVRSKWVAEKLILIAGARGLPVSIYRLGMITGHSETGVWNTSDFVCNMVKACLQIGYVPERDMPMHMTPVDYVVKAIVHLSCQLESRGKVFHLTNPESISINTFIRWLSAFGSPVEQVSYPEWRAILARVVGQDRSHPFYPLLAMFPVEPNIPVASEEEIPRPPVIVYSDENTRAGLAGTSISCPQIGPAMLEAYYDYFTRSGFLAMLQPNQAL